MKVITITSGFFDPLGVQHIALFQAAKDFGDYHICGVNSDECGLMKKKQKCFMPLKDRMEICRNLRTVDEVRTFEDCNDGTACQLLQDVYNEYEQDVKDDKVKICFMNGGDRSSGNDTPEQKYVDEYLNGKVEMVYGVGGFEKIASSSDYLRNWVNNTCARYDVDFKLKGKY